MNDRPEPRPVSAPSSRLILYVRTNDTEALTAVRRYVEQGAPRAMALFDDAGRGTPDRGALQGSATSFVSFLFGSPADYPPRDEDVVLRIDYRTTAMDPACRHAFRCITSTVLKPGYLDDVLHAFAGSPRVGLAVPAGLPRNPLEQDGQPGITGKLAAALGLPVEAFQDAHYFSGSVCFFRGKILRTAFERYVGPRAVRTDATDRALELSLPALARAGGFETVDLTPRRRRAGPEALADYVRQLLDRAKTPRHPEYRPLAATPPAPVNLAIKYIAYYLPQFHAIPENDAWWGPGFTEWTNVSKAAPRFVGHLQPRQPGELGFYDLRRREVMARQVELARAHGLSGFCFYYYWFNGKTLLETPLEQYLASPELDFPFCLCWANENWTRRWDGQEQEILIAQSHSPRDDLQFIRHIEPYLRDPRYIRIEGRPVLLVYRASLLDNPRETARRWREHCVAAGIGDPYLVAVCSFDIDDARPFGFDAAVEFPPHQLQNMPPIDESLDFVDPGFSGEVLDYRETVLVSALSKYAAPKPDHLPRFPGVMTGWDNDPRRNGRGRIFHHASPTSYANWLRLASAHAERHLPPDRRFVFINAWNEWAEGAYLEPDQSFGYGYLAATAETATLFDSTASPPATDLGSSSAALQHLPAALAPIRSAADLALYRQRAGEAAIPPSFRVLAWCEEPSHALLDTIYTVAEQSWEERAMTLVSPQLCPDAWGQRDLPVEHLRAEEVGSGFLRAAQACAEHWLILSSPGDRLFPHTLLALAAHLAGRPGVGVVVADELEHDDGPEQSQVRLRTALTPELLRSRCEVGGFLAIRRDLFVAIGGLRAGCEGASMLDLVLRAVEHEGWCAASHLPEIAHWHDRSRHVDHRLPDDVRWSAAREVVHNHLLRLGLDADVFVQEGRQGLLVRYRRPDTPLVTIIVPTRDQPVLLQRCIESLLAQTSYPNFEILVVDNDSRDDAARAFLTGLAQVAPERIRVVADARPFNFGALNNRAARQARGDYLVFLNDDTAALHGEWLEVMVELAAQPDVGIVGARLVFPDGRLQHAGVVLGLSGAADFPWTGAALDAPGLEGLLQVTREVSAVSGACMLVKRTAFDGMGGFDEDFPLAYADFDLCIRSARAGLRAVWTPHATLMHEAGKTLSAVFAAPDAAASAQASFVACRNAFVGRWRKEVARDPLYHPSLSLNSRSFELERNPQLARDPIDWHPLPNVIALPADDAGSGHYRVTAPVSGAHGAARIRGRLANGYPLPLVLERLGIDTLFTQRQVDDAQLAALRDLSACSAVRVVMDFDDLLTHIPRHSVHAGTAWSDMERRVREACALSHRLTASTEALAQRLSAFHHDVRVVPNGIDATRWQALKPQQRASGKLRVGWAGGLSHAGDLAVVRELVARFADEVEWVFLGMTLDSLQPHLTEFHRGVPFAQYPAKLAELDLDLAIAPLEINAFNESKSNLRLLEYGALGIPVIATDIVPYRCCLPVTLVGNRPQDWIAAVGERLGEREALRREGARLREAVFAGWTLETQLPQWVAAWSDL